MSAVRVFVLDLPHSAVISIGRPVVALMLNAVFPYRPVYQTVSPVTDVQRQENAGPIVTKVKCKPQATHDDGNGETTNEDDVAENVRHRVARAFRPWHQRSHKDAWRRAHGISEELYRVVRNRSGDQQVQNLPCSITRSAMYVDLDTHTHPHCGPDRLSF